MLLKNLCRLRRASLLPAFLLAAASAASGQTPNPCTPPTGDTGFAEIEVNVDAGTFNRVLPFDVPLRICGRSGPEIQRVEVRWLAGRQPLVLSEDTCKAGTPGLQVAGEGNSDGTSFRVVTKPLEAQRYYVFCFLLEKSLSTDEAAAFAVKARATLDQALAGIKSAEITQPQVAALRDRLRQDLETAADADQMISTGTLFDPNLPAERVDGRFLEHIADVLEPQLRRVDTLNGISVPGVPTSPSYGELQLRLRQAIDELRGSPELSRFADLLDTASQRNVNLATLLSNEFRDELGLVRANEEQAARFAQGLDPAVDPQDAAGEDLATTTDPATAAAIAAAYQRHSQTLSNPDPRGLGLEELINDALGNGITAPYVKDLTAAERATLKKLAEDTIPRAASLAFALSGQANFVGKALAARSKALDALVRQVQLASATVKLADASTTGNFQTSQSFYISADAGLLIAPEIDEVVPYVGTNIYFRPVNKNASLRSLGSFGQTFTRRFALTLGLTTSSIAETQDNLTLREDLFGSQALVVGAGLRLTDSLRVGAGAFVFRQNDPSPLIDDLAVTTTYYISASFDLDVARAFQGGFGALFGAR